MVYICIKIKLLMKRIYFILLILPVMSISQELDSLQLKQFKEQIKQELKQEIKNDNKSLINWSNFSLRGYGVINYYNYDYDTDPALKDNIFTRTTDK